MVAKDRRYPPRPGFTVPRPERTLSTGSCVYCGRPTLRVAANGKPACSACDDLPGKEAL